MERLLEEVSFHADGAQHTVVTVNAEMVNQRLGDIAKDEDLSRYVL